jgi:hypothetical protein
MSRGGLGFIHKVVVGLVPTGTSSSSSGPFEVCDQCSAENEEGWKAVERATRQKARLESVEKMLAGLRRSLPADEQLEPRLDDRRAELIKELEMEGAALLEEL